MRKLLRRGVTGIALTAAGGCAYAADMPLKAPPPAIYDWTGCYIGVHAGGGALYTPSTANNGGGGIAGGQLGCNYQSGSIVVGIEGEGWWSGLRSALSRVDSFEQDLFRARNRWDLDIALRAGVAVDRVLIYSKVGAAWGRFDFGADFAFGGGGGSQQATGGLTGLLLGTGLEYALTGNWTGKIEYNYIGFLGSVLHFDATGNVRPFDGTISVAKHIVKVGLNYRFGDPIVAREMPVKAPIYKAAPPAIYQWTGCYIGVHGGGGVQFDQWTFSRNHGGGGLAGGQAGCNYQAGSIVVGVETDASWSALKDTARFADPRTVASSTVRNRWTADAALRVGVAVDRALIYGKAGAAAGRFDFDFDRPTTAAVAHADGVLTGLLVGTGLEYAFAENWTAKLEYNYIGYVGKVVHVNASGGFIAPFDGTITAAQQIVKAGLNYQLGGRAPMPAAPSPHTLPAAVYQWAGCYIGAHGGAGVVPHDAWTSGSGGGGLAGGQAGCDYQIGRVVVGIEGEAYWSGIASTSHNNSPTALFGSTLRNRWDADVALRAGVAVDRALLYSKVGAAWGRFDLAADLVFANRVDPQRASGVLTGLLLGTGLEYAFAGNWSAKAEYNYIGYFGKVLHVDTNVLIDPSYDQTISATKHIVKLGINYRFAGDDAVVVKY